MNTVEPEMNSCEPRVGVNCAMKNSAIICSFMILINLCDAFAPRQQTVTYDLRQLLSQKQLDAENRVASPADTGIKLSSAPDDGVAWIKGADFSDGTIEIDLKGKNVEQQSFLGIAFHGIDLHTLDAVYFRPFNFRSADSAKRLHMVEYVSHPIYPWQVLREKFNGQYEKGILRPPDPDGWFHARFEVHYPEIKVFVNGSANPCLVVKQLDERRSGRIGLWVGNYSDGNFAHLKVTYAK
jgi:hypothetical protein